MHLDLHHGVQKVVPKRQSEWNSDEALSLVTCWTITSSLSVVAMLRKGKISTRHHGTNFGEGGACPEIAR